MLPVEHLQPVERAPTPRVLAPPAAPNGDSGAQSDAHSIYQTLGVHGGPSEAPQRGLYRSIGDETLSPVEHLQQALGLRLRGGRGAVEIPPYVCEAIRASTDMGVPALQAHRRREIRRWGEIAASLPRRHDEPFHAALVEVMDHELDLLARGPSRFTQVADPIRVARQGAAVVGVVEYPHVFGAHPKPPGPPAPLQALYAVQAGVHARILGKIARTSKADREVLWASLEKEVEQGFGRVHVEHPPQQECPFVYYHRFVAHQERWDEPAWATKPRPCDDATDNGVNGSLQCLSLSDVNTLDRFAETAARVMRHAGERGDTGGFACLVFDHDQAYRRITRNCPFRALIPITSPGAWLRTPRGRVHVPQGTVVYLEMDRLLFGEGGAVPGYCCPARMIAIILARILLLPCCNYVDDFSAVFALRDATLPEDVRHFLLDILRVHLSGPKFKWGVRLIHLGMHLTFSPEGIEFGITANRRAKYMAYIDMFLARDPPYGAMSQSEAAELGGRLAWTSNALFGRCGRAYLVPILRRAANSQSWPRLNGRLRGALQWWKRWLASPPDVLTRRVLAAPRVQELPPCITYSDASTDFGVGGVLLCPATREAWFFRDPRGEEPIDRLEVEAALVTEATFAGIASGRGYDEEITFVDNNASLAWLTSGWAFREDVDPLLEELWLSLARRKALKWWERVSSASNLADLPSRGHPPVLPSAWSLTEIQAVVVPVPHGM